MQRQLRNLKRLAESPLQEPVLVAAAEPHDSLSAVALVEIPEPFDFELSTARFRAFGLDRATCREDGMLYRAVGGARGADRRGEGGVDVEPLDAETETVVRKLVGFEFDLVAFSAWAAGEERLAPLVVRFAGYRPTLAADPFEMLVGAITAQQVSLFSALAIRNRLVERLGERVGRVWAFPTRERVAAASEEELFSLGFSRRKAEYVIGLARSDVDLAALALLPDEEVQARLTALRGLGEWTADWFLARYLGRPRAWPAGDLALRKAVRALYGDVDVRASGRALRSLPEPDCALPPRTVPDSVIRQATTADRDALHELWLEFGKEIEDAAWRDDDSDEELEELDELTKAGTAWIAEDDAGSPVGIAFGRMTGTRVAELRGIFVRPAARGGGVANELTRSFLAQMREAGAEVIELDVVASNESARATYSRWGFQPFELRLAAPVDDLEQRLEPADGPTFGFVHVQTDDVEKVKRDAAKFLRARARRRGRRQLDPRPLRCDRRRPGTS